MSDTDDERIEKKARRAAAREGLIVRKDRRRGWNATGGFDLIEPSWNIPLGGGGFNGPPRKSSNTATRKAES
jgi:hypothetical protein